MQPILTVNIITYNHEKYIAKCLDSILSQKTEYEFIIRVFDDCSPDTTLKILSSYKEKYPTKVFVYPSEKNQGSLYNALRSYKNIETKYYMYIEGDDYVCSDEKLQEVIDRLKADGFRY